MATMVVRNLVSTVIAFLLAVMLLIVFLGYFWPEIKTWLVRDTEMVTIYIGDVPFDVTVADTQPERSQGLSGTDPLGPNEGMLFIFDRPDYYGFWMKDMNYPIDILWFDNNRRLVHIEENVRPESYPQSFGPDERARFVVELAAFTADARQLQEGAALTMPSLFLPDDIRQSLQ